MNFTKNVFLKNLVNQKKETKIKTVGEITDEIAKRQGKSILGNIENKNSENKQDNHEEVQNNIYKDKIDKLRNIDKW